MRIVFYFLFSYFAYWIRKTHRSRGMWIFVLLFGYQTLLAHFLEYHGQGSTWVGIFQNASPQWGLRFIPTINATFNEKYETTFEASCNAVYDHESRLGKVKPYRLWASVSKSNWAIRLGLQQINFGSASLLRPLMWFDRIDPRDPIRITDGIYSLFGQYYFANNANLWTWVLFGNEKTKGWELFGSSQKTPEWGARIQSPVPKGEIAFAFHHRTAQVKKNVENLPIGTHQEIRIGIDGKWDIGPGLWFEESWMHRNIPLGLLKNQHLFTLGMDYTFAWGHGLYVLSEHLVSHATEEPFGSGKTTQFSAFMIDYPLDFTERISGILFWDWKTQNGYRFFNWQKTTDRWNFYVMVFWNSKAQFLFYQDVSVWNGKGAQFLIVWHF